MFAVVFAAAIIVLAWPNRYDSDGLMYVRLGRGALSVDPTAQATSSVSLQDSRASEVASVAEMLASREIAERVVNALGVETVNQPRTWISKYAKALSKSIPRQSNVTAPGTLSAEEYKKQIATEEAIKKVQTALSVSVTKKGHTVAVSAETPDPLLSQSIVQTVMDQYGSYHVEAHRADGSLEFFKKQVESSRAEAIKAREELQSAKSSLGWLGEESAVAVLKERMTQLKIALDEAESIFAESESHAASLGKSLDSVAEWIPTEVTKGVANNAGDSMRNTLYGLQLRGSEELSKLSPNHPRYQMMKSSIDKSVSIAETENAERELSREAVNPVRQSLQSDYELAIAKAAGAKSRRDSLQKSLRQAQDDLVRLNNDAIMLSKLTWEADIAEKNYLEHAKSLEEVRIADALDQSNLSDVSVIQQASLKLKKVGPPRALLLAGSIPFGLCLGILQALLRFTLSVSRESHRQGMAGQPNEPRVNAEAIERVDEASRQVRGPHRPTTRGETQRRPNTSIDSLSDDSDLLNESAELVVTSHPK
tara:strand:+ start:587320 stop:588930 length:1611 start_codon:yes stop_codon:yes gene_type:complete